MKHKRMNKRRRFEVLKRDGFQCAQCGAVAPEVLLDVFEIRREGLKGRSRGEVTLCSDCNPLKPLADATLEMRRLLMQQPQMLEARKSQIDMMLRWQAELQEQEEDDEDRPMSLLELRDSIEADVAALEFWR